MLHLVPLMLRTRAWIDRTLREHAAAARPVAAAGFPRLSAWFDADLLAAAKVIVVDPVPTPPLREWGAGFDLGVEDLAGVTYRDTFFVDTFRGGDESLFFHELIHVIQWRRLGVGRFIALYGLLLRQHGYADHPLERIAYQLQSRFDAGERPINVTPIVERHADETAAAFAGASLTHRMVYAMAGVF